MKRVAIVLSAIIVAATMRGEAFAAAGSCDSLKSLRLPDTTITATENIPAGRFTAPGRGAESQLYRGLPEFCRVSATLKPTDDSDIKVEIWLPTSGWNGKLQAVGNGAWNGAIGYAAMADALRRGYATSSTDTGHVGGSAS